MYWKSKYIIIDTGLNVLPIVFSELQQHAEVAHAFYATKDKIMGAGFVSINAEGHYQCYGESVSLGVKSRGDEDSKILNRYLGVTND